MVLMQRDIYVLLASSPGSLVAKFVGRGLPGEPGNVLLAEPVGGGQQPWRGQLPWGWSDEERWVDSPVSVEPCRD